MLEKKTLSLVSLPVSVAALKLCSVVDDTLDASVLMIVTKISIDLI